MENNIENKRNKVKPYPLNWKILNLLKIFQAVNLKGFVKAMKGVYSEHAIRKALPKLERGNDEDGILIYSTRDMNKNKVYYLTERGIAYLKDLDIRSCGCEETEYKNLLIHWSSDVGGSKINVIDKSDENFMTKNVEAVKYNDDADEFVSLIKEKEGESLSELLERIEQAKVKGYITNIKGKTYSKPFDKIYVYTKYPERESKILSLNDTEPKISRTKIELYKIA